MERKKRWAYKIASKCCNVTKLCTRVDLKNKIKIFDPILLCFLSNLSSTYIFNLVRQVIINYNIIITTSRLMKLKLPKSYGPENILSRRKINIVIIIIKKNYLVRHECCYYNTRVSFYKFNNEM